MKKYNEVVEFHKQGMDKCNKITDEQAAIVEKVKNEAEEIVRGLSRLLLMSWRQRSRIGLLRITTSSFRWLKTMSGWTTRVSLQSARRM